MANIVTAIETRVHIAVQPGSRCWMLGVHLNGEGGYTDHNAQCSAMLHIKREERADQWQCRECRLHWHWHWHWHRYWHCTAAEDVEVESD